MSRKKHTLVTKCLISSMISFEEFEDFVKRLYYMVFLIHNVLNGTIQSCIICYYIALHNTTCFFMGLHAITCYYTVLYAPTYN